MKNKSKNGITLIALIITVIILLILAGTAISISINGSNIFEKTSEAREDWNAKVKTEEVTINDYLVYVDDLTIPAWDGTVGTSFAGGTGTEENPYTIENGEQLAYFAKTVRNGEKYQNTYISITKSINLGMQEFTPIGLGSEEIYFDGTLDGNENIITGICINKRNEQNVALIRVLGTNGTVKNLKIGNGNINGSGNVGSIVGKNNGKIINCSNKADIYGNAYQVAGIAGTMYAGSISDCVNTGEIKAANGNAAGIVGTALNGTAIDNCINRGNITSEYQQAGGIVGRNKKSYSEQM